MEIVEPPRLSFHTSLTRKIVPSETGAISRAVLDAVASNECSFYSSKLKSDSNSSLVRFLKPAVSVPITSSASVCFIF